MQNKCRFSISNKEILSSFCCKIFYRLLLDNEWIGIKCNKDLLRRKKCNKDDKKIRITLKIFAIYKTAEDKNK